MTKRARWISILGPWALVLSAQAALAQPSRHYDHIRSTAHQPMSLVERLGPDAFPLLKEGYRAAKYKRDFVKGIAASRHPESRDFLIGLLADPQTLEPQERDNVRREAIAGLLPFGSQAKVALAIAGLIDDKSRSVNEDAVEALLQIAHPATVEALIAHAKKDRRDAVACRTLIRIWNAPAKAYIQEKLSIFKDAFMPFYGEIALEAARQGRTELTPILIEVAGLALKNRTVRPDVFRALGLLGDKRAVPVLRQVLLKRDFRTRYWCAVALGQLGDRAALPDLKAAFDKVKDYPASRRWVNQSAMAYAMARLGDAQGRKHLLVLLEQEEPETRMFGLLGLMRLEGDSWAEKIVAAFRLYADIDGCPRYPEEEIFSAMLALDSPLSTKLLAEVAQFKKAGGAKHWALTALERFGTKRRAALTIARMRVGTWEDRSLAARDLDRLLPDPYPLYVGLLADGDLEARLLAVRRLGLFARERFRKQLQKATRDPAWQVALEAERLLARKPGEDGFPRRMPRPPLLAQTDLGGYLIQAMPRALKTYTQVRHELDGVPVRRLAEDGQGVLWAATRGGLQRYDGMQWKVFAEEDGLCSSDVYDVIVDGQRVLAATTAGVSVGPLQPSRKTKARAKARKRFRCLPTQGRAYRLAASGKQIYAGTEKGVLALQRGKLVPTGGPSEPIGAMVVDRQGALWVALIAPFSEPADEEARPPLLRLHKGRWTTYDEAFHHYYGQMDWQYGFSRQPISVRDLTVDGQGRLLLATTYGIFRRDGEGFTALSRDKGYYPWHVARSVAAAPDGRVLAGYAGYVDVLEKGRWRRLAFETLDETGAVMARGTPVVAVATARTGGFYFCLMFGRVMPGSQGQVNLVRWAKKDPARVALPPDTLIARVQGGALSEENQATDMAPPNQARKFNDGRPLRVPANIVTFSAVAKDPWDYSEVEYRFKIDEDAWTAWSKNNGLISPQMLDEGVHRVLAQSRDAEGNVDPSPAEVRFAVHTKDLTVIRIQDGQFQRIFPSQYVRYQKVGLGRVQLENTRDKPVEINLEMKIEDLFERPAATRVTLGPKEKKWVDVGAPFSDKILTNEGQRSVQAVIEARYSWEDVDRSVRRAFPVELLEANAFVWDEPARLAAFINGRDPLVQKLASDLYRDFAEQHPQQAKGAHPLRNYLLALYAYQALSELGIQYKPDSGRPFESLKPGALDTVQYPSQTLLRKTGDCDDLTVLYASVLENLNVPTAVLPVAGHVFLMFDAGVRSENRAAFPVDARKTVDRAGRLWVPVETTLLGKAKRFEAAWTRGAENYHGKYRPQAKAAVDVRLAWQDNPPATRPADPASLPKPALAAAASEAGALLSAYGQVVASLAPAGGEGHDALVAKGAVLAKSGLFDQAAAAYGAALKSRDSFVGHYGLAAAQAGQGEMLMALVEFQKALKLAQDGQEKFRAQLAIAQCYKVNGNLKKAKQHLDEAVALNPAARFDARYRSLVRFLQDEQETKAAADDESPPFFQEILSGL